MRWALCVFVVVIVTVFSQNSGDVDSGPREERDLVSPACLGLLVLTGEVGQPVPSMESPRAAP